MKSFNFPHMLNLRSSDIISDDHTSTAQNLINLLSSEKGELLGDPYFGVRLRRYIYDQNSPILEGNLIDELYTQIAAFMPQIKVERKNITIKRERGKLTAHIVATNMTDFTVNAYDIVLFSEDEKKL